MPKFSKSKKIIISLPAELVNTIDAYIEKNDYNRSEFIRYAIRMVLKKDGLI